MIKRRTRRKGAWSRQGLAHRNIHRVRRTRKRGGVFSLKTLGAKARSAAGKGLAGAKRGMASMKANKHVQGAAAWAKKQGKALKESTTGRKVAAWSSAAASKASTAAASVKRSYQESKLRGEQAKPSKMDLAAESKKTPLSIEERRKKLCCEVCGVTKGDTSLPAKDRIGCAVGCCPGKKAK
jgi:hypothetical protein